jgi:cation:H+ antiporter
MIYLAVFFGAGLAVVLAGIMLARFADDIAEATGVGRLWIGSVLLAGATSLPELATDVSAVRMDAVDLAVGDLFGSTMANMLILAVVDLAMRGRQLLKQAALDHGLAASLALSLNALAAMLVIMRSETSVLGISPGSALLVFIYVAGSRAVYRHVTREGTPTALSRTTVRTLRRPVLGFGLAALMVFVTAPAFAWSAKGLAGFTGLGHTFVGTWLVGLSTSMPELVASLAAVRMGAFDMAVGNLFGSNAFNMAILAVLDASQPGSLFAVLDPGHSISAMAGIILMSLGLAAIMYRAKRRFAMVEPDSLLIAVAYALSIWLLHGQASGP